MGTASIPEITRAYGLRPRLWLLCQRISLRMAATVGDSVVAVVRTRPRSILLHDNYEEINSWVSYIDLVLAVTLTSFR